MSMWIFAGIGAIKGFSGKGTSDDSGRKMAIFSAFSDLILENLRYEKNYAQSTFPTLRTKRIFKCQF